MKILAIIINIFFPGVGTLFVKKFGQAFFQIILSIIAFVLMSTGILSLVGIPLGVGVWIWGIISVVNTPDNEQQPIIIREVIHENNPQKEENAKK